MLVRVKKTDPHLPTGFQVTNRMPWGLNGIPHKHATLKKVGKSRKKAEKSGKSRIFAAENPISEENCRKSV